MVRAGQVLGPNWGKYAGKHPKELLRNRGQPFVLHTREGPVPSGVGGRKGPLGARLQDKWSQGTNTVGDYLHPWTRSDRKAVRAERNALQDAIGDYYNHRAWNPTWEMPVNQRRRLNRFWRDLLVDQGVDRNMAGKMARGIDLGKKIEGALAFQQNPTYDSAPKAIRDLIDEARAAGASSPVGYDASTSAQLSTLCRERGLTRGGTKADKKARLVEYDEKAGAVTEEEGGGEEERGDEGRGGEEYPWEKDAHGDDIEDIDWFDTASGQTKTTWDDIGLGTVKGFAGVGKKLFLEKLRHYRKEYSDTAPEAMDEFVKTHTPEEFIRTLVNNRDFTDEFSTKFTQRHIRAWKTKIEEGMDEKAMDRIIRYITNRKHTIRDFKKVEKSDDPFNLAWMSIRKG